MGLTTIFKKFAHEELPSKNTVIGLSNKATQYLSSLERQFASTREETITYLNSQNFPLYDKVIDFQVNYSGVNFTIKNKPTDSFYAVLFSAIDISAREKLDYDKIDDKIIFDCGGHITAQFNFYLTDMGEFCTLGNDDKLNILSSSFDVECERYALKNELSSNSVEHSYYYNLENAQLLNIFLENGFAMIKECSDDYSVWLTDGKFTVDIGTWLDRPDWYLHIYGSSEYKCMRFIKDLKKHKIIC